MHEYQLWLFDRYTSKETRGQYLQRVRQADRWMRENRSRPLERAKADDVRAYLRCWSHPRTRNGYRTCIGAFMRFAKESGRRRDNPMGDVPRVREPHNLPRPIPRAAVADLRRAAQAISFRHRLVLDLLLYTGLRRAEMASLEWSDIDLEAAQMRVRGKGDKERLIPIHADMIDTLGLWRVIEPGEYVFQSKKIDGHVKPGTIGDWMKPIRKLAGVYFTAHRCRHTNATEMLRAGADVRRVQKFLGHASLSTTALYTDVVIEDLRPDVERLDFGP